MPSSASLPSLWVAQHIAFHDPVISCFLLALVLTMLRAVNQCALKGPPGQSAGVRGSALVSPCETPHFSGAFSVALAGRHDSGLRHSWFRSGHAPAHSSRCGGTGYGHWFILCDAQCMTRCEISWTDWVLGATCCRPNSDIVTLLDITVD